MYVDVHTTAQPGGHIAGQLVEGAFVVPAGNRQPAATARGGAPGAVVPAPAKSGNAGLAAAPDRHHFVTLAVLALALAGSAMLRGARRR